VDDCDTPSVGETRPGGALSQRIACEVCGHPVSPLRTYAADILVQATPEAIYDLVTDISRTGEWSPICRGSWWDTADSPRPGAWFTSSNQTGDTVWETRAQVDVATPGREYAWLIGDGFVRWAYTLAPVGDATLLGETWQFLPAGIAMFHDKYLDRAHERIALRVEQAVGGIPATLAAIKRIAETG
jgi:hypothetical protein